MLDISVAYDKYNYYGSEFLTWLWYAVEKDAETLAEIDGFGSLRIGNNVKLSRELNGETIEAVTIKGDDAGLEEGMLSLAKGALVSEMSLVYESGDHEYRFTLRDDLAISGLKTPKTEALESKEDLAGATLEKFYLQERVTDFVDGAFRLFLGIRLSDSWRDTAHGMRGWVKAA